MKGPFSIWALFGLTIFIDIFTIIFFYVRGDKIKRIDPYSPLREVSVIIPAHKEKDEDIIKTVKAIYNERYPIKNLIICGSPGGKKDFMEELKRKYENVYYIESAYASKARKVNFIVKNHDNLLGEFVYVRDCRVKGNHDCIEKMIARFDNKDVAAVTSYGRVSAPKNFLSRAYFYGKAWINEVGRFRKNAQEKRKAVFVVCGASTVYKTEILKKVEIPYGSKTEDTYYTWVLQNKGYRVNVADDAVVSAPEVDGNKMEGIIGQVKQSYRWSSGTIQCMYRHGRDLPKNKRLFYTTIFPGFLESVMYTIPLVLLPLIFLLDFNYFLGFLIGDTVFSLLGTLVIIPKKFMKTLVHYPEIFFFKYLNSLIFLCALFAVTAQAALNRTEKWTNEWNPLKTEILNID
jgi:cellulose synthase/poly-beta-1,6-N-acetylglucosamine synthase-like glycosyltransferase